MWLGVGSWFQVLFLCVYLVSIQFIVSELVRKVSVTHDHSHLTLTMNGAAFVSQRLVPAE